MAYRNANAQELPPEGIEEQDQHRGTHRATLSQKNDGRVLLEANMHNDRLARNFFLKGLSLVVNVLFQLLFFALGVGLLFVASEKGWSLAGIVLPVLLLGYIPLYWIGVWLVRRKLRKVLARSNGAMLIDPKQRQITLVRGFTDLPWDMLDVSPSAALVSERISVVPRVGLDATPMYRLVLVDDIWTDRDVTATTATLRGRAAAVTSQIFTPQGARKTDATLLLLPRWETQIENFVATQLARLFEIPAFELAGAEPRVLWSP